MKSSSRKNVSFSHLQPTYTSTILTLIQPWWSLNNYLVKFWFVGASGAVDETDIMTAWEEVQDARVSFFLLQEMNNKIFFDMVLWNESTSDNGTFFRRN